MKKLLFLSIILNSCVCDHITKVAVIKNRSGKNIAVVYQPVDSINDKLLFGGDKLILEPDSTGDIFSTSSAITHFYFFDYDTVSKYINEDQVKGIVQKAFLQHMAISEDSLEKNDTLIYFEKNRIR
jgi:hypothetical protein